MLYLCSYVILVHSLSICYSCSRSIYISYTAAHLISPIIAHPLIKSPKNYFRNNVGSLKSEDNEIIKMCMKNSFDKSNSKSNKYVKV